MTLSHVRGLVLVLAIAVLSLTTASPAAATGLVARGPSGSGGALIPLHSVVVDITVDGTSATTSATRTYGLAVSYEAELERALTFYRTLPAGASVDSALVVGEAHGWTLLSGEEADAAREALTAELGDPAPLAHLGQDLLVLDPVIAAPGEWAPSIQLTVTQELAPFGSMRAVSAVLDWHRAPVGGVSVSVTASTAEPLRALYSPYDDLSVVRDGAHAATASAASWDRDPAAALVVALSTGDDPIHLDLVPFRYGAEEGGFFMALVTPESSPPEDDVAGRDIVIALDQSGSMEGQKIVQARAALDGVLAGLRAQDRVQLVTFHTWTTTLADQVLPATPENLAAAETFVADIVADGGTNIGEALDASLGSLPLGSGRPRYVVLITDGLATEGLTETQDILDLAAQKGELGARIFTFGVGLDVNTVLLDQLAHDSGGQAFYLWPGQSIDMAVAAFFERVAAPLLAAPALDLSAFGASMTLPSVMQDLYAGQTAVLLGRYADPGAGTVSLSGVRDGDQHLHTWDAALPALALGEGFVPRVWANRLVGTLLHEVKLGIAPPGTVDEAMAIASRWGVVTDFTTWEVDEAGDVVLVYSEVPEDAVGSVAVATSASLDEDSQAGTVDLQAEPTVRHAWDRALPLAGGWFTDTSLPPAPEWVDLTFASDRYFELVRAEASLGVGDLLATGSDTRFEHFGRAFRVTSAHGARVDGPPPEATTVPAAAAELLATPGAVGAVYGGVAVGPAADPTVLGDGPGPPAAGCGAAPADVPLLPWALCVAAIFALGARRRLRTRAPSRGTGRRGPGPARV